MALDHRQQARQMALSMRSQMALTTEHEEVLWWLLQRHASPAVASSCSRDAAVTMDGETQDGSCAPELCLNYDEFTQVAAECRESLGPSADVYFQASIFLRLARDAGGCVPAAALFRYCSARSTQMLLRTELCSFDTSCRGWLSPLQLQQWLQSCAPAAACSRAGVSEADWCTTVAARLLLMHGRRGRVAIRDLVASQEAHALATALQALAAAAATAAVEPSPVDGVSNSTSISPVLAAIMQDEAWFSPAAAAALRCQFNKLDADGDGLLSQHEFSSFSQGTMTSLAIQRLFAHHCGTGSITAALSSSSNGSRDSSRGSSSRGGCGKAVAGGGMDFAAFCAFCAAWDARHHPAAIRFFFPLLDQRGCGYLGLADLYTLIREVLALWVALGQQEEVRVEDVLAEVNDLLQAPDPGRISVADLHRCGTGGTIIGLLLDVNLFWEYENREALLQQHQQAQAAES